MNVVGVNNSNQWGTLSKASNSNQVEEKNKNAKSIVINQQNKNSAYAGLEKIKEDLVRSKQALSDKDMDPKEKKAKLDDINNQIYQIEAQIQQAKTIEKEKEQEKLKKEVEEKQSLKLQPGDEVRDGVIVSESLKNIIASRQSMDNISNLKATKAYLSVEKAWLTPNDNPDSFVSKQYAKLSNGINGLEQRISYESSKVHNIASNTQVETSVKTESNSTDESKKEEKVDGKSQEEKDSNKE